MGVGQWWDQSLQDVRYAMRSFFRAPGFTLAALGALALGIGASTAVFSFVDRILFRPLPYTKPQELVWFGWTAPIGGGAEFLLEQNYLRWRNQETPFTAIAVTAGGEECSLSELNPAPLRCFRASANLLSVLGYRALAGRDFTPEEGRVGAPPAALISRALWMQRFGGGEVTGKTLEIDGRRTSIVGVLPEDFEAPTLARVDVLQVLAFEDSKADSAPSLLLTAFGRLRTGVTPAQARARMEPAIQEAMLSIPPGFRKEVRFVIHPLRDRQVRDSERAALFLLGAVSLVLLIAVANVANLLLARTAGRRRELAVRAAMGASKGRLARQALTESLCLGLMGAGLGLARGSGGSVAALPATCAGRNRAAAGRRGGLADCRVRPGGNDSGLHRVRVGPGVAEPGSGSVDGRSGGGATARVATAGVVIWAGLLGKGDGTGFWLAPIIGILAICWGYSTYRFKGRTEFRSTGVQIGFGFHAWDTLGKYEWFVEADGTPVLRIQRKLTCALCAPRTLAWKPS